MRGNLQAATARQRSRALVQQKPQRMDTHEGVQNVTAFGVHKPSDIMRLS